MYIVIPLIYPMSFALNGFQNVQLIPIEKLKLLHRYKFISGKK